MLRVPGENYSRYWTAAQRVWNSCFFSHALFRRYLRKIFLLGNARILSNVCTFWLPGGPKSRRTYFRRIRTTEPSFLARLLNLHRILYRSNISMYGFDVELRVSLKKEGARPSSNNATIRRRVSSKSCSDGREMGSVTSWIGFVSSYLAASLETRRSNRHADSLRSS